MVKSPKIRHSKPRAEPVTIDLSAEKVAAEPKSGDSDKDTKGAAAMAGEAKASLSAAPEKPSTSSSTVGARPTGPATSAFGRDPSGPAQKKPDTAAKDDATPKSAAAPSPKRQRSGVGGLVAGLAGGIIALAGAAALYASGYLPQAMQPPVAAFDNSVIEQLETEIAGMRDEISVLKSVPPASGGDGGAALEQVGARVESMAVMVEDLRGQISRLSDDVAAGGGSSADVSGLQTRLAAVEDQITALPEAGAGTDAMAEIARIEQEMSSFRDDASSAATDTDTRIASVEQALTTLTARVDEQAQKPGVALAIAASALKAAIDRGQPFPTELETFAALAPDAPEVAALREMAASGVPTAAEIATETDDAAVRMIAAARQENTSASLLDRLWASAESLVTVRPIGAVEGEDVPAIVARVEAALKNGNYSGAISEFETLPDEAKAAGSAFVAKVKARQAADELVGKALANALRA